MSLHDSAPICESHCVDREVAIAKYAGYCDSQITRDLPISIQKMPRGSAVLSTAWYKNIKLLPLR
jgi:hypothetical protein